MAAQFLLRSRKIISSSLFLARVSTPFVMIKARFHSDLTSKFSKPSITNPLVSMSFPSSGLKSSALKSYTLFPHRHFASFSSSKPCAIKVVSKVDFKTLSHTEFEKISKQISYRFPLVKRVPVDGDHPMRRTVLPGEFPKDRDRSFMMISVGYGEIGFDMLVCTESTDFVGVRGLDSRIIVFKETVHQRSFAALCGVEMEQMSFFGLNPEGNKMFVPTKVNFEEAINTVVSFINSPNLYRVSSHNLSLVENSLGFFYNFLISSTMFLWTKNLVDIALKGLVKGEAGDGAVKLIETVVDKKEWVVMSNEWYLGNSEWTSGEGIEYTIREELAVVKGEVLEVVAYDDKYNPAHLRINKQKAALKEFERKVHEFSAVKKDAAVDAWLTAQKGFDEEEYFSSVVYQDLEVYEAAREAFRKATIVYYG